MNDPSQNQSSHYYMHSGENPSIPLVNSFLNQKNYHTQMKFMKRTLISNNKWKLLDGSIVVLDRFDPSYNAWERCNNLIHSWIVNSIIPSIAYSLIHVDLTKVVQKKLKERFSQCDLVRVVGMEQYLYSFKQGDLFLTNFFTELTVFWEELETYRPIVDCNYDSNKFKQQSYVMRFLMGLKDCYFVINA